MCVNTGAPIGENMDNYNDLDDFMNDDLLDAAYLDYLVSMELVSITTEVKL